MIYPWKIHGSYSKSPSCPSLYYSSDFWKWCSGVVVPSFSPALRSGWLARSSPDLPSCPSWRNKWLFLSPSPQKLASITMKFQKLWREVLSVLRVLPSPPATLGIWTSLDELLASAQCVGTRGLCPDWGTCLLHSSLQVQPIVKLSTYPSDTQTDEHRHTHVKDTNMAGHTDCHRQGAAFNSTQIQDSHQT